MQEEKSVLLVRILDLCRRGCNVPRASANDEGNSLDR
jgi:hypothetical protein